MEGKQVPLELVTEVGEIFESILKEVSSFCVLGVLFQNSLLWFEEMQCTAIFGLLC